MSSSRQQVEIGHGHGLLELQLATKLLVLALEQRLVAGSDRWHGAWRSAMQPGAGIVGDARVAATVRARRPARPGRALRPSATSRTIRASPAMSRACSIRQTARMARCVSATVTVADYRTRRADASSCRSGPAQRRSDALHNRPCCPLHRRGGSPCDASAVFSSSNVKHQAHQSRRPAAAHVVREVRHLLDLPYLDHLVIAAGTAASPIRWPPRATPPGSSSSRRALPSLQRTGRR